MKLNENQKDYFVNEFKVYILLCLYPSNSNPNESTDIKLKIKHCVESGFRKKYAKKKITINKKRNLLLMIIIVNCNYIWNNF